MIDTIVLALEKNKFQITDPDKFLPSARLLLTNNSKLKSSQNPTKKDLLKGIYMPRLTLFNKINKFGKAELILKVELSLPKLFYGNNFQELSYKNFDVLNQKLLDTLQSMGISTNLENIASAQVWAIHYSKNIALTDGSTPYHYINKIKEANINLRLDINQTNYRNEGYSYKWHCNSYEVIFYDKIKDLQKAKHSSKRAIEKQNEIQLNIFDKLRSKKKKLEILRMEVRLNKRQKIKQLLNKLKIKSDLTFKKLFKPAISKKVLLHYLDELESKRPILIEQRFATDKALLTALIFNNRDLSISKTLQFVGLKKLLETMNLRELRNIFANHNHRSCQRLMAEVNKIKLNSAQQNYFEVIRKSITKFKLFDYRIMK